MYPDDSPPVTLRPPDPGAKPANGGRHQATPSDTPATIVQVRWLRGRRPATVKSV